MIKDYVCEHGSGPTQGNLPSGTAWMGPIGTCECCGCAFGYIDSVNIGSSLRATGRSWVPKNRCANCGGEYREF